MYSQVLAQIFDWTETFKHKTVSQHLPSTYSRDFSIAGLGTYKYLVLVLAVHLFFSGLLLNISSTYLIKIYMLFRMYLGAAKCIISTAQQARPNVIGHKEPFKKHKVTFRALYNS